MSDNAAASICISDENTVTIHSTVNVTIYAPTDDSIANQVKIMVVADHYMSTLFCYFVTNSPVINIPGLKSKKIKIKTGWSD